MKKYNILLILFILFTTASCSGLLDEDPRGDVAGSNFFTDEENALSNINDLYNAFGDANVYSRQAMMVMEFGTDLGTRSPSDNWPTLDPIATYTHDASAQRIWWVWRDSYPECQPLDRQYRKHGCFPVQTCRKRTAAG